MIDPRAAIDPGATLAADVSVGPFAVIGPGVEIGAGTRIGPHAVIQGPSRIGRDNVIYQFASVGERPQDKKYRGEDTWLEIGDRNQIREFTTLNRGTAQDRGVTRIGSDNLLMAYTHVAHDCVIGDNVILANAASLGGHVEVEDWAILGGFAIVHQFCRIGAHSFAAMGSVIAKDVPPFVMIGGHPAHPHGLNLEGLRRRGYDDAAIRSLKRAYKQLYLSGLKLDEALQAIAAAQPDAAEVRQLLAFLQGGQRSLIR